MAHCVYCGPNEDPTALELVLVLLLCFGWSSQVSYLYVWKVVNENAKVVAIQLTAGPPILTFDLCDLLGARLGRAEMAPCPEREELDQSMGNYQ